MKLEPTASMAVSALCSEIEGSEAMGCSKSEWGRRWEAWRPHQYEEEAGHTTVVLARWRAHGSSAWWPRIGHMAPIVAFYRTRGVQRSSESGTWVWVTSEPNLDMGQKAKSKPTQGSTNVIKAPRSLGP
jgi:hypothetical protein